MADSGNRVIIADDDGLMRGVLRSVLMSGGHDVFIAINGPEAIALARQFVAKLVLLDISMPKLTGLQTYEAIRALPGYSVVPIVVLTGQTNDRLRMTAKKLGVNKFMTKPFRPDQLLEKLAVYLNPSPKAQLAAGTGSRVLDDGHPRSAGRGALWISRDAERNL